MMASVVGCSLLIAVLRKSCRHAVHSGSGSGDATEHGTDLEEVLLGWRGAVRARTGLRVLCEHVGACRARVRGSHRAGVRCGSCGHGGDPDRADGERQGYRGATLLDHFVTSFVGELLGRDGTL